MKFYLARVLSAAALFALAGSSNAALLFADSFTYPNGDLTSTADWEAHSGAASTPVQVVDGHAALVQGAGSREDVNAGLSSALVANQTLYMGFDLTTGSGANQTYFAHFARDNGVSLTDFHTRIFTTGPSVGGNYTLGLRSATDSSPIKLPVDLTFGETYRVVASYEFNTGISKLWVNPTSPASTSVMETAATGIAFDHIALRQAGGNALQSIDNLVVATTFDEVLTFPTPIPEPHSVVIALMGACAVGAIGMRKRLG